MSEKLLLTPPAPTTGGFLLLICMLDINIDNPIKNIRKEERVMNLIIDAICDFFEDKKPFVSALAAVVGFMTVFALSEYYLNSFGEANLQLLPRLVLAAVFFLLGTRAALVLMGLVWRKDGDVSLEMWVDLLFFMCSAAIFCWNFFKALTFLIRFAFSI